MLKGDTSFLLKEDVEGITRLKVDPDPTKVSNHIHLTGVSLDFNKNAGTDELRLAFSIMNRDGAASSVIPDEVRVLVEFASTDILNSGEWARFDTILSAADYDFINNRYYVNVKQIQQLQKSPSFTWSAVNVIKIYGCVINDISNDDPSGEFYIGLDALRLENVSTTNPLYGLSGYSIIKSTDAKTVTKLSNTTNYLEFRFTVDVQ
jgi:hypothetical protein